MIFINNSWSSSFLEATLLEDELVLDIIVLIEDDKDYNKLLYFWLINYALIVFGNSDDNTILLLALLNVSLINIICNSLQYL